MSSVDGQKFHNIRQEMGNDHPAGRVCQFCVKGACMCRLSNLNWHHDTSFSPFLFFHFSPPLRVFRLVCSVNVLFMF